jgi:hypothetical protein
MGVNILLRDELGAELQQREGSQGGARCGRQAAAGHTAQQRQPARHGRRDGGAGGDCDHRSQEPQSDVDVPEGG